MSSEPAIKTDASAAAAAPAAAAPVAAAGTKAPRMDMKKWNEMFNQLLEFKKEKGHCRPPAHHTKLGTSACLALTLSAVSVYCLAVPLLTTSYHTAISCFSISLYHLLRYAATLDYSYRFLQQTNNNIRRTTAAAAASSYSSSSSRTIVEPHRKLGHVHASVLRIGKTQPGADRSSRGGR